MRVMRIKVCADCEIVLSKEVILLDELKFHDRCTNDPENCYLEETPNHDGVWESADTFCDECK